VHRQALGPRLLALGACVAQDARTLLAAAERHATRPLRTLGNCEKDKNGRSHTSPDPEALRWARGASGPMAQWLLRARAMHPPLLTPRRGRQKMSPEPCDNAAGAALLLVT